MPKKSKIATADLEAHQLSLSISARLDYLNTRANICQPLFSCFSVIFFTYIFIYVFHLYFRLCFSPIFSSMFFTYVFICVFHLCFHLCFSFINVFRQVKGNSECPVKRGRVSAVLLPHLPMLLSQIVRWGLPPPDWGKSPNPPLSSLRLRSGGLP